MSDILQRVRDLQFTDISGAEALLISFLTDSFGFEIAELRLTPLAISLNSFNGFITFRDGTTRFFKSHTESDTVINEYYNAERLLSAGYPVIQPIFKSTEPGKQFLMYELITAPSVFDLAWQLENNPDAEILAQLRQSQNASDQQLLSLYRKTYKQQSVDEAQIAPIHQLFYHRLTGGRLDRFYGDGVQFQLPSGIFTSEQVRHWRWVINGQQYSDNLNDIIERSIHLLNPAQADVSVVGHGDAHNGNVFYMSSAQGSELVYFDPAFAGSHHPLLDITKPLFHNVFAMWMYYPREKQQSTKIDMVIEADTVILNYDYPLLEHRRMFFESKVHCTLLPLLQDLQSQNMLRLDWRAYLKSSLFCCPFLTMNLADNQKFPPEISALGLAMAVEMGSESQVQRSLIDLTLDNIEAQL